ncbi:MAG TPA: Crp/Fnr family transcriptional regulator [Chitinophagaceae bacterium]|nr:Crp/Fnr family transcriptional regulator [Chitinophagaceae bacterium]
MSQVQARVKAPEASDPLQPMFQYFRKISNLSDPAELAIREACTVLSLPKNQDLQPVGHACTTIYFILRGSLRIYYFKDDLDITESFSFENSIVARVESLFTGRPSKKGIQIMEDAELVAIHANRLFRLYDAYPEIERLFRKIFEATHVDTINRMESIQFHTAEERYRNLLTDEPDIIRRAPLKFIASYLGITPTSLSRIRARK